jgi:peroxiredoxin
MKDLHTLPADLPVPQDDGAARHLAGALVADVALPATDGSLISLARLTGRTVVYAYPRTGEPGRPSLAPDWDMIPGARGCTPQSCSFRDHHSELAGLGARVFGLSTQDTAYQREAAEHLHLPFPLLSDASLAFAMAMRLPVFEVAGHKLLKRATLVLRNGVVEHVFYPVFPPDRNAAEVVAWLSAHPT